jgi:hypothetical protein
MVAASASEWLTFIRSAAHRSYERERVDFYGPANGSIFHSLALAATNNLAAIGFGPTSFRSEMKSTDWQGHFAMRAAHALPNHFV